MEYDEKIDLGNCFNATTSQHIDVSKNTRIEFKEIVDTFPDEIRSFFYPVSIIDLKDFI